MARFLSVTYNITSNQAQLIVYADRPAQIAQLMQQAAGEFVREHNRRKHSTGAFWEGCYHATMVSSDEPIPVGEQARY